MLRIALSLVNLYALAATIDIGLWYHYIRGQATFKLYVIFNVLEILDRLHCAFGSDIFDSLVFSFCAVTRVKLADGAPRVKWWRALVDFLVAQAYVISHSLIIFSQIVTLNVAINSQNNSLLTLLISNNFVEIKASIFKKFGDENLFQLCASDMVERFNLTIFLLLAVLQNLRNNTWSVSESWFWEWCWIVSLVYGSEIIIDWTKHCFVIKFNSLPPDLYSTFKDSLYLDLVKRPGDNSRGMFVDQYQLMSRNLGFVPLPLACVVTRVLFGTIPLPSLSVPVECAVFFVFWACLVALKILIQINLIGAACKKERLLRGTVESVSVERYRIINKNIPF